MKVSLSFPWMPLNNPELFYNRKEFFFFAFPFLHSSELTTAGTKRAALTGSLFHSHLDEAIK